jgi:hypothetical protein
MPTIPPAEPQWIGITEAARLAGISRQSLRRMAGTGALDVRRLPGTRPRYRKDQVVALTEARTFRATAATAS